MSKLYRAFFIVAQFPAMARFISCLALVSVMWTGAVYASENDSDRARKALASFELTSAAAYVDRALAKRGDAPELLYMKARIEILEYRFDDAMTISQRCIDQFPTASICFETLGEARSFAMVREDKIFKQVKLMHRSVDDWLHAVELDPKNVRARILLIRYYRIAPWILGGSKRKARDQVDAIARIDPQRVAEARGMMSFYEEDWKDAIEHLEDAVAQDPDNGELRYHLASARAERGDLTRAVEELREVVSANPEFWEAYFHLGLWCVEANADNQVCFDALGTYVNGAKDAGEKRIANAYYAMGKLREQRGELALALAAYE
ncbi:MAG: tetratricopeptide repeat protein, partial [Gammaproteobacteria bacterium]